MPTAPDAKILEAIAKTGFVLEHKVVTALQAAGWNTINGSFYIDDVSEQARELDVIAYKIARSEHVDVLTCVLVSCKKDASHTAAFMSRKRPRRDPNADWEPIHYVCRLQPLKAHLSSSKWKDSYFSGLGRQPKSLLIANRDIFAFQMVSADGKPHNDKPHHDSVTGLLKALDHEINKRNESTSSNRKRVYHYSLHTVFEAPMVDVEFTDEEQQVRQTERITCFSRFMVRKRDTSASIHFLSPRKIHSWIDDLNALHEYNGNFFPGEVQKSYEAILTSKDVRKYFQERIGAILKNDINMAISRLRLGAKIDEVFLDSNGAQLTIEIEKDDGVGTLNSDPELKSEISETLAHFANYAGPFQIVDYFPF